MTPLVKYWVNSYSVAPFAVGTTNQVVMHLAADVEKVVAELQHWRDAAASVGETDGHGMAETIKELKAELARVKGELEKANAELNYVKLTWVPGTMSEDK